MKTFLMVLMSMMLVSSQAFATKMYYGWCGGSSRALIAGNKGVIVPAAPGSDLGNVSGADQMALQSAYGKAMNYRWSLADGVNSSMTPEQISTKLSGQADFFVVLKTFNEPNIHEEFSTIEVPYEAGEDWEYIRKKYDSQGKVTLDEHYTVPAKKHTEYITVEGVTRHYEPVWLDMLVYDGTGRQIFTGYSYYLWDSCENNSKKDIDGVMEMLKDYNTQQSWKKIDNKPKMKTSNFWKDPSFKFDKKVLYNVVPTAVTAPYYKNPAVISNFIDCNLIGQGKESGMNISRYGSGAYRMEADIVSFEKHIDRVKPFVETYSTSNVIQDRTRVHDKIYKDIDKIICHTKHGKGHQGSVRLIYDNLGLVVRIYDNAANKLVFSYSGSVSGYNTGAGVPTILEDFYKKLKK